MYKRSDFTKPAYKTAEIMKILNISYSTIKNYDKQGKLPIHQGASFVIARKGQGFVDKYIKPKKKKTA